MADIINMFGDQASGSEDGTTVEINLEPGADEVWLAASALALADKALWGALLYVDGEGTFCYVPIKADEISMRGLIETAKDALVPFRTQIS